MRNAAKVIVIAVVAIIFWHQLGGFFSADDRIGWCLRVGSARNIPDGRLENFVVHNRFTSVQVVMDPQNPEFAVVGWVLTKEIETERISAGSPSVRHTKTGLLIRHRQPVEQGSKPKFWLNVVLGFMARIFGLPLTILLIGAIIIDIAPWEEISSRIVSPAQM